MNAGKGSGQRIPVKGKGTLRIVFRPDLGIRAGQGGKRGKGDAGHRGAAVSAKVRVRLPDARCEGPAARYMQRIRTGKGNGIEKNRLSGGITESFPQQRFRLCNRL